MTSFNGLQRCFHLLIIIRLSSAASFNQPRFCPNASWNPNATTFATSSTIGSWPIGLFITTNNTVIAPNPNTGQLVVWRNGSSTPTSIIPAHLSAPWSVFVTGDGQIFVDNNSPNNRIDGWTLNMTRLASPMPICSRCTGLFVDINSNLYCSQDQQQQVLRKSLNDPTSAPAIIAGTGCAGSASNMLSYPNGIFVTETLDLYVADWGNNRIQFFRSGELNGTTVAGTGSTGTISLSCPTDVILDADGYLFIADNWNNRIVGSGPDGFRCLVGCSQSSGASSNQLHNPQTMSFDTDGNIFVMDMGNSRIQKFMLLNNSCDAAPTTSSSTSTNTVTRGSNASMVSVTSTSSVMFSATVRSFNQPKLCPNATWNLNATTFATSSIISSTTYGLFITTNNTIVVPNQSTGQLMIWLNGSSTPTSIINASLSSPWSVSVTSDGQIFVDNNSPNSRIDRWTLNGTQLPSPMPLCAHCAGLFIDINNNLYCAHDTQNQVLRKSLNDPASAPAIVAGTGCSGSASNMLNAPNGIFVTENLDLYVADWGNNRIQLFRSGKLNGTTVAGNGSTGTISLYGPTDVVLDADGYLFIVDCRNNRIVGSGADGFRCLVGCSQSSGASSSQLSAPQTMRFDTNGNIFVMDTNNNNRIQKFMLLENTCDATTMAPSTTDIRLGESTATSTSTSITSPPSTVNLSCSSPSVTLIPSTSNLSSPFQFRRNQDFSLSSTIALSCNLSHTMTINWTVKNCSTSVCLSSFPLDSTVISITSTDFYLPARTLPIGLYQLTLTVTVNISSSLTSAKSAYLRIIPSGIVANLLPLGSSMITSGSKQDLQFNPGLYSVDLDADQFNASNWNYRYYCRVYGVSDYPQLNGSLIAIGNPQIDPLNPSCLSNRSGNGVTQSQQSSLLILSGSLRANQTYQFMLLIESQRNQSLQYKGFLLVRVQEGFSPMIVIGCVISILCVPDAEFQRVNPTTQVSLFALCLGNCSTQSNITWNIYQGSINASSNNSQWTLFNQMNTFQDLWFFGKNTSNFTSTNQLFLAYPQVNMWQFEVVYSFPTATSSSTLTFAINQPPANGSCSIGPSNGTTTTPFNVSCSDWFDQNGIQDYSLYLWSAVPSERTLIAFASVSTFLVQLPSGSDPTFSLQLMVSIRDTCDCVTEWNLTPIVVEPDSTAVDGLINQFQSPSTGLTNNPLTQLLTNGNQNTVGQVIGSLSQQLNQRNTHSLADAVSGGVPAASVSISTLDAQPSAPISIPLNVTALNQFNRELNSQATVHEYLVGFVTLRPITTLNAILSQATSLAQLTTATNQLTRALLAAASTRCYQLAKALQSMADRIAVEDLQASVTQLMQCSSNLLTGVNAPLQQRTIALDADLSAASTFPSDYDTDLESDWSKLNFDAYDGSTSMSIDQRRNLAEQKQLSLQVTEQMNQLVSLLTNGLNLHLNLGQRFNMTTPGVIMSVDILSHQSLINKEIQFVSNARIRLPATLNGTRRSSLRSTLAPLASFGQPNTNLSRSISLTLLDEDGNVLPLQTNPDQPVELLIPRDTTSIIPPMYLQNVTGLSASPHQQLFNLHFVDLSGMSDVSVHLELRPLATPLSYLLIYRFDLSPVLNTSLQQIDGWTLFCPTNLSNGSLFTTYIDNHQTFNHRSVIFGLRELNPTEMINSCSNLSNITTHPPLTNERFQFTANYELRLYTSGCFYLDESDQTWKSDGLTVGPLTNHEATQCFSTHLN